MTPSQQLALQIPSEASCVDSIACILEMLSFDSTNMVTYHDDTFDCTRCCSGRGLKRKSENFGEGSLLCVRQTDAKKTCGEVGDDNIANTIVEITRIHIASIKNA